jgi:hypothetical protein
MNIKQIRGKKSLKLLFLLLTSLLISSVSASIYYTMFMNATIGVTQNKIKFTPGADYLSVGGSITDNNQTVTFSSMSGQIGSLTNITDPVRIRNTDSGSNHTIELKLGSWTGNTYTTQLYYINVTIYDTSSNLKEGNTIHLVPGGSNQVSTTGRVFPPANALWRVEWDIYWTGSATTSNSVTVDLQLVVWS